MLLEQTSFTFAVTLPPKNRRRCDCLRLNNDTSNTRLHLFLTRKPSEMKAVLMLANAQRDLEAICMSQLPPSTTSALPLAGKTYTQPTMNQQGQQQQISATSISTPATPSNGPSSTTITRRRHLPQVLVAKLLTMILQNGTAIATQQPRPNSLAPLNALRAELLLHCPFFDPEHKPGELSPRTRRSQISFAEVVVLMARLIRVLMKQGGLSEAETRERVEVRNACLDQPFFDRELVGSARPFAREDGFVDEGCVM